MFLDLTPPPLKYRSCLSLIKSNYCAAATMRLLLREYAERLLCRLRNRGHNRRRAKSCGLRPPGDRHCHGGLGDWHCHSHAGLGDWHCHGHAGLSGLRNRLRHRYTHAGLRHRAKSRGLYHGDRDVGHKSGLRDHHHGGHARLAKIVVASTHASIPDADDRVAATFAAVHAVGRGEGLGGRKESGVRNGEGCTRKEEGGRK